MDKKQWYVSLLSAITALAALFALWPNFEPALDWFVRTSALILLRPQVQAVLASIAVGVLLAGLLPHVPLPWWQRRPSGTTKAVTRFLCVLVTFAACMALSDPHSAFEQRSALVYSTLAAFASSAVWTTLSGLLYRVGNLKPESLK